MNPKKKTNKPLWDYTNYEEDIYVGYRYFDTFGKQVSYPFGYGLSYTTFDISAVTLDQNEMDKNGRIAAHVTVKNTGDTAGCDVVQLYIRDDYSDVVRPVRELKGFRRVELAPGKEQEVTFYITEEDLRYYRLDGTFGSEPGTFTVFVGDSSTTENSAVFTLK